MKNPAVLQPSDAIEGHNSPLNTSLKVSTTMSYQLRQHPPQPTVNLQSLADKERMIQGGALWNLQAIQQKLATTDSMRTVWSSSAEKDATHDLMWNGENLKAFMSVLHRARYTNSEWCYATNGKTPYAADVYLMGFNRHKGEENQRTDPWVYFKFSVLTKTESIIVLSSHFERKK